MQFTPRSALEAPPLTGASFGPAAPVPLPVENLAKAAEKPRYRMSRTAETIPALRKEWIVVVKLREAYWKHYNVHFSDTLCQFRHFANVKVTNR
jgi:hypothetical protein